MVYSIRSLLEKGNVDKVFFIVEDDKLPFNIPIDHKIINVGDGYKKIFPDDSPNAKVMFTRMALMRTLTARLLPDDLDTVLQMDVDTIICDKLDPVFDINLTGKYFAAVQEYKGQWKPYGEKYYNVGVMLMNLKLIRETGIDYKLVKALNEERFQWGEQCTWNKYCLPGNKIADIPVRFNETQFTGFTDNPAIVHFAGTKDWYNCPQYMIRREYLEKYKWGGFNG